MLTFTAAQVDALGDARRARFEGWLLDFIAARAPLAELSAPRLAARLTVAAERRGAVTETEVAAIALLLVDLELGVDFGPIDETVRAILSPRLEADAASRLSAIHALMSPDQRARHFDIDTGA